MVILQWACDNDCPIDEYACYRAAQRGNLHMLMWLRERNCPWDDRTRVGAAESGDLATIEWVHNNECPAEILTHSDNEDETWSSGSDS